MTENNTNEIEQELKSNLSIKLSNESCFDFLKRLDSNSISLILIDPLMKFREIQILLLVKKQVEIPIDLVKCLWILVNGIMILMI